MVVDELILFTAFCVIPQLGAVLQLVRLNENQGVNHHEEKKIDLNNKTILVTGSPGFIGANLVLRLLNDLTGGTVISFDNMND